LFRSLRFAFGAALISAAAMSAAPVSAASQPISISLSCYSSPEKTTIKNVSTRTLTVKSFGSTYQPYSAEPFHVNTTLAPGKSVTYKTGSGSRLYGNSIYNNNGKDGVKVVTSVGTFGKHC
jgi:hypothetical protein